MFEEASRLKLRYSTSKGLITVEDLWDLPLTGRDSSVNLDNIAVSLARQLRDEEGIESFVTETKKSNDVLRLKFDVVKRVIDVRLAENEVAKQKADAKLKKERIMAIIERKQTAQLESSSMEELQKMINEL